jgi:hypothetical protein
LKNNIIGKFIFSSVIILFSLNSCDNGKGQNFTEEEVKRDSVPVIIEKEEPPFINTYKLDSIVNMAAWDSLYSPEQKKMIYALNRIEQVRVGPGVKLLVPDSLVTDLIFYSPFPENLELLDSIPKTVLIAQRIQAFGLYENGKLIKWGPVSSGKQSTPTPNGLHYGNYKAKRKVSTVNSSWILPYYFNFMNFEGVGVHQYLLPGFPASHACVRLDMDDAMFIYGWANQWQLDSRGRTVEKNGTPFMVFGEYDFEAETPPWMALAEDPEANFLNKNELDILSGYVKKYFKDPRNRKEEEKVDSTDLLVGL